MKKIRLSLILVIVFVLSFAVYQIVVNGDISSIPTQENSSKIPMESSSKASSNSSQSQVSSSISSSSEATATVSYTDDELAALDNTSKGWGQGLNKNAKKPTGGFNILSGKIWGI